MKITIHNDAYVVGDIHGDTSVIEYLISFTNLRIITLILLGDIGIFRYRDYKRYLSFDKFCNEHKIDVYAFRGNHDNPGFFRKEEHSSPIAKRFWAKFTNFKALPDFSEVKINDKCGIVLGGGVSFDRSIRRSYFISYASKSFYAGNDWWADENIPNIDNFHKKYDFVLTHSGPRPAKLMPLTKNNCSFFALDPTLQDAIDAETTKIEQIHEQIQPTRWWFGHYHINDDFDFRGTRCKAVDINCLTSLLP